MAIDFKIKLLGNVYGAEDGLEFAGNPSIEIVRNDDERAIYEKPVFDFNAFGQLYEDLEAFILANPVCGVIECKVFGDGELVWTGDIKTASIEHVFNDPSQGSYKSVEILDQNFNSHIKSNQDIEIDMTSVFDLDCGETRPPAQVQIEFFNPDTPATKYIRSAYFVRDVFDHIIDLYSRGNVVFTSDVFTTGKWKDLIIMTGDMLMNAEGQAFFLPVISYKRLWDDIAKYLNLWIRFYESGGVQYAQVEEYSTFFDNTDEFTFDEVSAVKQVTKIERLYATVKVGEDFVDYDFKANWAAFELDSFNTQIIDVSNRCSSETQLDLTGSIIYDTDKIDRTLQNGTADQTYQKNLFLVETNGLVATMFTRSTFNYYNDSFLNAHILDRYFDGIGPISAYPSAAPLQDYFKIISTGSVVATTGIIPGAGAPNQLNNLWYRGHVTLLDVNGIVGTANRPPQVNGAFGGPQLASLMTIVTAYANVKVRARFNVSTFGGTTTADVPDLTLVIRLNNPGIVEFISAPVVTGFNAGVIEYETPAFAVVPGDTLSAYIYSNVIFAAGGQINWAILKNSTLEILGCPNFQGIYEVGNEKNMLFDTSFTGYPITQSEFDGIRSNPTQKIRIISGSYVMKGYIQNMKYDLLECATEMKAIGKTGYEKL